MDIKQVGWEDIDWISLSQDRNKCQAFVTMVMNTEIA